MASKRGAWLFAAIVLTAVGVLTVAGALWDAIVEAQWWKLVAIPVAVLLYFWLSAGALRRARR